MDQADIATATCRHDGWTPERKALFLDHLASRGNVRAACASVGMSREAAYKMRRRDGVFGRSWDAALLLARDITAETIGDRAIDGIEEEVWYRGELVGTRRRYDARLLLARMARLDKLTEEQAHFGDAERFDELVACVAGVPIPEPLTPDEDDLPPSRDRFVAVAEAEARQRVDARWAERANEHDELADEDYAAFTAEAEAEEERAGLEAAALWDEWHAGACAAVDALRAPRSSATTVSNVSTSAAEMGPLSAQPEATRKG